MIRVAIAESEPLARAHIARLLRSHPDFVVVGQFGRAFETWRGIRELAPELIFLDLELPDLDRFDARILEEMEHPASLIVIAGQAGDGPSRLRASAVERLFKPFDGERFEKALSRAVLRLRGSRRLRPESRSRAQPGHRPQESGRRP